METRRRRSTPTAMSCRCSRSLPIFSSFIFLAAILPGSSFAQLSTTLSSSTTPTPTTFSTSIASSPPPSPTHTSSNDTSTSTQSNAPAQSSSAGTTDETQQVSDHVFNYYFLIVATVAIVFCLCILWVGRRKKRKAAMMRNNSQRALARDVEGFRGRFGMRRPGFGPANTARESDRVEGLDERGEAPPPYVPGSKPPSLRDEDGIAPPSTDTGVGDAVELRRLSRPADGPPGYNEHVGETANGDLGIARPFGAVTIAEDDSNTNETNSPRPYTALTASDGYSGLSRPDTAVTTSGSTRRLLNSSGGSGQEGV